MHREDKGEEPENAHCNEGPDKEPAAAGSGDAARDADTLAPHVEIRDTKTKERIEKDYDVSGSAAGEYNRCVQPKDKGRHSTEIPEPSLFKSANDVACEVKCKQEDREQRRDG